MSTIRVKCPECQQRLEFHQDGHECRQCLFLYPHNQWRSQGRDLIRYTPTSKRKPISIGLRRRVMERDGWRCLKCNTKWKLTLDHVVPLSMGGTNTFENLQTLCDCCNNAKRQDIIDYRRLKA